MLANIATSPLRSTVAGVSAMSAAGAHVHHQHQQQHDAQQLAALQAQGTAPQQETVDQLTDYNPQMTGLGKVAEKASHTFFMADMGTAAAAGATGWIGKKALENKERSVIGKPLGFLGKGFEKVSNIVGAPRKALEETHVGNALESSAKGAQKLVGKVSKSAASGMDVWIERAQATQQAIGERVQSAANFAADKVGAATQNETVQKATGWMADMRTNALNEAHAKFAGTQNTDNMNAVRKFFAKRGGGQLSEMEETMQKFANHATYEAGERGAAARQFQTSYQALHTHISDVANLHDSGKTQSLLKTAKDDLKALQDHYKELPTSEAKIAIGNANAGLSALESGLEPLSARVGTVAMLKNPAEVVRTMPAALKDMNLHQATMNTVFAAGSAMTITRAAKNFNHDKQSLIDMVTALEGKKEPVSLFHAMFGSTDSTTIKAARTYMMKVYSAETLGCTVDVAVNIALCRKGGMSMSAAMPVMMAGGMIPAMLHGHNAMTAFGSLNDIAKSGAAIGPHAYAQFIQQALPQAQNIAGDNGLLVAFGEHYAAIKATPAQMMHELESNHITQVASELQQKLAAQGRQAGQAEGAAPALEGNVAQAHTPIMEHPATQHALHTAAVVGSAALAKHPTPTTRTVMGQHTAKVMNASAHHPLAHTATATAGTAATHAKHTHELPHAQIHTVQHHGQVAANNQNISLQA